MNAQPGTRAASLALLTAVVGWGMAPVATQLALRDASATTVLALRFSLVTVLLLAARGRRRPSIRSSDRVRLLASALLGVVGYNVAVTFGLRHVTASTAGFIIATEPVFILILAHFATKEPVTARRLVGVLISLIGVAIIATDSSARPGIHNTSSGVLLVLLAAVCFAAYTVTIKPLSVRYGALTATRTTTLIGSAIIMTATLPQLTTASLAHIPLQTLAAIAGLALGSTILAMFLYNHATAILGPVPAGAALNLIPLVTAAGGLAVLAQPIQSATLIAGPLVLVGVALANGRASASTG